MKSQNRAWIMFVLVFLLWQTLPGSPFAYFADMIRQWLGLLLDKSALPGPWQPVLAYVSFSLLLSALLLLGRPFGFVALLGVIALMGMIQRNSVILIDQIEQDRARGVPAWDAIVESAVRRLRPIVLTAAAAVLAMIPLSRSVFWGPMAVAIMGGLIVATALTLLFLPALYAAWYKVRIEA